MPRTAETRDAEEAGRICPICGISIDDRRADAVVCGAACRIELSRLRRLMHGQVVDTYTSVEQRVTAMRRRKSHSNAL